MEGIIEHVNSEKGYGFIRCEDHEKNVFFHIKDFAGSSFDNLQKGDGVSIDEIIDTPKGKAAKGVRAL